MNYFLTTTTIKVELKQNSIKHSDDCFGFGIDDI